MSCSGSKSCACGCCVGVGAQTPVAVSNLPGLQSISYRTGTWATFRESMVARLSSSDYPALAPLKTRDTDDFTIAFLDATSVVLDILTFYQERLANESYLRTATQLRSLTELARLTSYQPTPGISAAVYLAFTLQATPGLTPDPSTPAIVIPAGAQAQSIPVQGQKPQTFETAAPIRAKADWNAQPVMTCVPWIPLAGDTGMYLAGTATQLQPGDYILIVGDERANQTNNDAWDVCQLLAVVPDAPNKRTWIAWKDGLHGQAGNTFATHPKVYALRQIAALFGYNAINPNILNPTGTNLGSVIGPGSGSPASSTPPKPSASTWSWLNYELGTSIDLDSLYPKIMVTSWLVMMSPGTATSAGGTSLFQASSVSPVSRSGFGLTAKITRIIPDSPPSATTFPLDNTVVLAQSEELAVTEQPLNYPLYGTYLDLENLRPDLIGIQTIAISGKNQKLIVKPSPLTGSSQNSSSDKLVFEPDDGSPAFSLSPGDLLTIINPSGLPFAGPDGATSDWSSTTSLVLYVQDASGQPGTVFAPLSAFALVPAGAQDPDVEECALVRSVINLQKTFPHTQILLQSNLLNCYDRGVTTVNANVGIATHGQSVSEVMGSGTAAVPNQAFTLRQFPLTFVQSPTASGRLSTLNVRANAVQWLEVPSLYDKGPSQQVFTTLNESDGTTDVHFGDGVEGATLPTGVNNVIASYRIGSGASGNVAAGAISTLLDRPLGVTGVNNPQAATGGHDPQTVDGIRANTPQTVLTLGRAVSLIDYQHLAATFAGIAKASATWISCGPARGVFLTVAGVNGVPLSPGNPTLANLLAALRNYGNPLIPINAQSFLETLFGLSADLQYDPAYDQPSVESQVRQTLVATYSFANRNFGQGVSADEVASIIQGVTGVIGVNVTSLTPGATSSSAGDLASEGKGFTLSRYNAWLAQSITIPRPMSGSSLHICPYVPVSTPQGLPQPADILVLHPDPAKVVLGRMV